MEDVIILGMEIIIIAVCILIIAILSKKNKEKVVQIDKLTKKTRDDELVMALKNERKV